MSETQEVREEQVRYLAKTKGFKLEKRGEGTPTQSFDYSLINETTSAIVVDRHQGLDFIENYLVGD
jgi:hypothetical protein